MRCRPGKATKGTGRLAASQCNGSHKEQQGALRRVALARPFGWQCKGCRVRRSTCVYTMLSRRSISARKRETACTSIRAARNHNAQIAPTLLRPRITVSPLALAPSVVLRNAAALALALAALWRLARAECEAVRRCGTSLCAWSPRSGSGSAAANTRLCSPRYASGMGGGGGSMLEYVGNVGRLEKELSELTRLDARRGWGVVADSDSWDASDVSSGAAPRSRRSQNARLWRESRQGASVRFV